MCFVPSDSRTAPHPLLHNFVYRTTLFSSLLIHKQYKIKYQFWISWIACHTSQSTRNPGLSDKIISECMTAKDRLAQVWIILGKLEASLFVCLRQAGLKLGILCLGFLRVVGHHARLQWCFWRHQFIPEHFEHLLQHENDSVNQPWLGKRLI